MSAANNLIADLLDHINALSEQLGDAAPDQRELMSKVNAWLEQRERRRPLTPAQILQIDDEVMKEPRGYCLKFARAIERAHGIGEQVQALKPMPEEIAAMPADWSVTVQVDAETVLSIGHDWVSGATDFDEDVILGAAKHLLSFIGYGMPDGGFTPPDDAQDDQSEMAWPNSRDIARLEDMSPRGHLRITLDNDNDVCVEVFDFNREQFSSIEFCTPGSGGGKSSHTRRALIELMRAMERDNAERPDRAHPHFPGKAGQEGGAR